MTTTRFTLGFTAAHAAIALPALALFALACERRKHPRS
jgi:hypothetical protein